MRLPPCGRRQTAATEYPRGYEIELETVHHCREEALLANVVCVLFSLQEETVCQPIFRQAPDLSHDEYCVHKVVMQRKKCLTGMA